MLTTPFTNYTHTHISNTPTIAKGSQLFKKYFPAFDQGIYPG